MKKINLANQRRNDLLEEDVCYNYLICSIDEKINLANQKANETQ